MGEHPSYYSDSVPPVIRAGAGELFLVIIEAKPNRESEDYVNCGGAYVSCWVDADDLRAAERRAVALIEIHGWSAHRFDSWELVNRETYTMKDSSAEDGIDYRELFEQTFVDGEVCIFHTWPIDAPDAGADPS